jgi:bifunctional non-homologous end joining protein LigD
MDTEDRLESYRGKRDFAATPEPAGDASAASDERRFVVQEHHATRLHWDLRLEHDGVLASWAIPNGIPPDPKENRLAVHTEDHPLRYLDFAGEIPEGQYGAGTMSIWDTGTFQTHKWSDDKVEVTFHGERLRGRYGLFPIGRRADGSGSDKDWMIHRMDPPQDPERAPMPERVLPMLAGPGRLPPDAERWSFEVKWDGVRALAHVRPGRLRLVSRNLNEITAAYPEVRGILSDLSMREVILDGEIVAFGEDGTPSFERLQSRMHVGSPSAIARLQKTTPVVFAIFDVIYLDGRSLMNLPYQERRARLEQLQLGGPAWRVPAVHPGAGQALLEATAAQGLEGVVAKRLDSRYEPGRRTGAWIKVKNLSRQELVIGGWLPGEGKRTRRIGALLMGVHEPDGASDPARLRYAGRVGTGFSERTLDELGERLAPLRTEACPFAPRPKLPRNAVFVAPELVAEVEFREWTSEGVMRAPSFKGLRDDKDPAEVVGEDPGPPAATTTTETEIKTKAEPRRAPGDGDDASGGAASAEAIFGAVERRPDGAVAVTVDGRALKLTNWDKVLFAGAGFTKGDLVAYYARIAPAVLPHLKDRPLTLKRYPNGVEQPFFYEKQSPSHRPEWVQTSSINDVNYTLCQDRATLVWLAGLADIELHTSLSVVGGGGVQCPTSVVFDLDPGPPADILQCCEVALVLRGLFAELGLDCVAKVSGSKGMQVYVPLNGEATYAQTKPFARRVAEALAQRLPELVVARMTKRIRAGRVLVDWSQNDAHKTTVSVYSVRARERPTVSAPVSWQEVTACRESGEPGMLSFETEQVLARVARDGDPFATLLSTVQSLPGG